MVAQPASMETGEVGDEVDLEKSDHVRINDTKTRKELVVNGAAHAVSGLRKESEDIGGKGESPRICETEAISDCQILRDYFCISRKRVVVSRKHRRGSKAVRKAKQLGVVSVMDDQNMVNKIDNLDKPDAKKGVYDKCAEGSGDEEEALINK
ncbi:hypothetical protein Ancab_004994 [Ancistrocladus abbreviatus]